MIYHMSKATVSFLLILLTLLSMFSFTSAKRLRTCLLVSSSVYEPLKDKLERWIMDVESEGIEVIQKVVRNESAEEVRSFLRSIQGLSGCLMVGDVPTALYEMKFELEGKPFHEVFPTDLYFMDLDGVWIDNDGNGVFDEHKGNISPEIWVGRLKASTLSEDEVKLLRNYFDKNHLYRVGALTLPHKALIYTDHYFDYYTYKLTPKTKHLLKNIYNDVEVIAYPQETTAKDYLFRLQEGWSLVRLFVHSGGFGHYFGNQTDGKILPIDIRLLDPHAFFYIITSCENFDYTRKDYIGGWYVFSNSYGLLAIGDSGVHDLLVVLPEAFFLRLKKECFGQAYLYYLQECIKENARVDSVYNAIMVGDPLLTIHWNGLDSDKDGLSDKYESNIGLDPHEIDSDHDLLNDYIEVKAETNPLDPDTDKDGAIDGLDKNPLDSKPETALKLINEAQEAIMKAEGEGKTKGLKEAEEKLSEAKEALNNGLYDMAIALAEEAKNLAEASTYQAFTTSAVHPLTKQWLQQWLPPILAATLIIVILSIFLTKRKVQMRKK
ncbi:MAG: C25 family cysteine peptidase [Candidatus Bathyarchaeia archaeon]